VLTPIYYRTCNGAPSDDTASGARTSHIESVWPQALTERWECVSTGAGVCATPATLPAHGWLAAQVPGTVAASLRAAGQLDFDHPPSLSCSDYWYRVVVVGYGTRTLRLHGLATIAEVWLDDTQLLTSDSMFVAHDVEVILNGTATLALCFRAQAAALAAKGKRARWRPRLVTPPTLRSLRTTLLGRMHGWCPSIEPVGPWRTVEWLATTSHAVHSFALNTHMHDDDGVVAFSMRFVHPHSAIEAKLFCENVSTSLQWVDAYSLRGELRVPHVQRWWPHTHGTPRRHAIKLSLAPVRENVSDDGSDNGCEIALGEVGFRTIEVERGTDGTEFGLRINGEPVFCRGACWTSADLVTLTGTPEQLAHTFTMVRDAGMNMIRVGGTMLYESDEFYRLADEYGVLIWQDFPFANFDYPTDAHFSASVEMEATQFLMRTRRYAALAVLCGGSEVDQQATMLGLTHEASEQPLFTELLPAIVARERPDVPYVSNSPTGGAWPFEPRTGVSHYYGVGAYLRPLDDARRAQVRFASECLAFANVPADTTLQACADGLAAHDPRWKAASPRDPGSGWDFDDVRDHYLRTLYGVEPALLRYEDPQRYLDLSRAVVADVMTETFSEWRRQGSTCRGALVWQLQDLRKGAGWGVIDATGRPKSAWYALAQVLQPVQIVMTDEGLNGLDFHLINETARPIALELDVVCLRNGAVKVVSITQAVTLTARSARRITCAQLHGRFFDFTHAYRFGPRAHDVTIATLRDPANGQIWSETFHLPERRALERHDLGLTATVQRNTTGWALTIETSRFARHVQIIDEYYRAAYDGFHLPPGRPLTVQLVPLRSPIDCAASLHPTPRGEIRAINAAAPSLYG
jgi:beta-mannosidase